MMALTSEPVSECELLSDILFGKEPLYYGFAVNPHLGAILHHLQRRVEFQSPLAVAVAGGYLRFFVRSALIVAFFMYLCKF